MSVGGTRRAARSFSMTKGRDPRRPHSQFFSVSVLPNIKGKTRDCRVTIAHTHSLTAGVANPAFYNTARAMPLAMLGHSCSSARSARVAGPTSSPRRCRSVPNPSRASATRSLSARTACTPGHVQGRVRVDGWPDAVCAQPGGGAHVAAVAEVQYGCCTTAAPRAAWLGLSQPLTAHNGAVEWGNQCDSTYLNWAENEPNDWHGLKEDCAMMGASQISPCGTTRSANSSPSAFQGKERLWLRRRRRHHRRRLRRVRLRPHTTARPAGWRSSTITARTALCYARRRRERCVRQADVRRGVQEDGRRAAASRRWRKARAFSKCL